MNENQKKKAEFFEQSLRRTNEGNLPSGIGDMNKLPEDKRIQIMAAHLQRHGKLVFIVDKNEVDPQKGDRYLKKLKMYESMLEVADRFDGPIPDSETIVIRLEKHKQN